MKIRSFNKNGVLEFTEYLDQIRSRITSEPPTHLIEADSLTQIVAGAHALPPWSFSTRFELGRCLHELFNSIGLEERRKQEGIWAWLSAAYFNELCPEIRGVRRPGERARWVPNNGNFRKYYRHLLAGPERIYRTHAEHPDVVTAVLTQPPHSPGDVAEQLSARQERISNRTVMAVATQLYVRNGRIKRGAAGRGPGSARRLANVLDQLDLTWDLYDLEPEGLMRLLPDEFDRFRPSGQ